MSFTDNFSNQPAAAEETAFTAASQSPTLTPNRKKDIIITGSINIDRNLIQICPAIAEIANIQPLIILIEDYIFGGQFIAGKIREITNEDAADFIEGIGIIARENDIRDIDSLQAYFDRTADGIDATSICRI